MSEPKVGKYGEPWHVVVDHDEHVCYVETSYPKEQVVGSYRQDKRIVECVNALAGIPSPSEYREAVDSLLPEVRTLVDAVKESMGAEQVSSTQYLSSAQYNNVVNAAKWCRAALERVEGENSNG